MARTPKQDSLPGGDLNPRWWLPTALTLMVVGLFYVIVYYVTAGEYPIPSLGGWNIAVGFTAIMAGFLMLTRWK